MIVRTWVCLGFHRQTFQCLESGFSPLGCERLLRVPAIRGKSTPLESCSCVVRPRRTAILRKIVTQDPPLRYKPSPLESHSCALLYQKVQASPFRITLLRKTWGWGVPPVENLGNRRGCRVPRSEANEGSLRNLHPARTCGERSRIHAHPERAQRIAGLSALSTVNYRP